MEDAELIRANKWRQGCILLPEVLAPALRKELRLEANSLLYILTHDCDLVQPNFSKEPYVEVLVLRQIIDVDGSFVHGKNSRLLDLQIGESSYRASCHERHGLDRKLLAQSNPSEVHSIGEGTIDMIAEWMSKRYVRPAFPDEFNRRLGRESARIRKFFKKHGKDFNRIYIICDPLKEELKEDTSYHLSVWLVLNDDDCSPESMQEVVTSLEQILGGCAGIEIGDCYAVNESELTLAHLRVMSLWDFDYLTYRELAD